jgi:hypothetical protein
MANLDKYLEPPEDPLDSFCSDCKYEFNCNLSTADCPVIKTLLDDAEPDPDRAHDDPEYRCKF